MSREKLVAIPDEETLEISELRQRLIAAKLPAQVKIEAEDSLKRLAHIAITSAEYGMLRSYLDWLASLPWENLTGGIIDISHARKVLDKNHYDLTKIKDRVLEYLAVKKLRQERQIGMQSLADSRENYEPVLCLIGPPGVGKTSLGISIARALGREFVRISLAGIHDEAEIRGKNRSYVGAMPGKIIQGIKRAKVKNPIFMLDEVDKMGGCQHGDPYVALLEVLDPAQNHSFVDNYLGVAFDLSQVLFITTVNSLHAIPDPLLDRMERLYISGYTDNEKINIAISYLIPKQLKVHGLNESELQFAAPTIQHIIRCYTREAGVRSLERQIATICRKIARRIAEGKDNNKEISLEEIDDFLGRPRYQDEVAERTEHPGVATGLVWTSVGGEILFVEATMMPGRNERLILTGMLGDVMRESAQTALSYILSNIKAFTIASKIVEENKTIHLHVPEGAIPKDGPSAGITIVTALVSLFTGYPINHEIAMTGEITLHGKILPVGGVKEKVLAAHRAGIKTIIMPRRNERDLEDVPNELLQQLHFIFVDNTEEAVKYALNCACPLASEKKDS